MHRRDGDILSHTKKIKTYIQTSTVLLKFICRNGREGFSKNTQKNYKQGKKVTPAHAAHTHATLPKYFAGSSIMKKGLACRTAVTPQLIASDEDNAQKQVSSA